MPRSDIERDPEAGLIAFDRYVIGEIEPILGRLGEDRSFDDLVMDTWMAASGPDDARSSFERLGEDLAAAKAEYVAGREIEEAVLGRDYET
mgnify:CR=1 FL=1